MQWRDYTTLPSRDVESSVAGIDCKSRQWCDVRVAFREFDQHADARTRSPCCARAASGHAESVVAVGAASERRPAQRRTPKKAGRSSAQQKARRRRLRD